MPSSVLPPKDRKDDEKESFGIAIPKWLSERLTEIAKEEGYSRNEVVGHFLKWALQQHEREMSESAPTEKKRK